MEHCKDDPVKDAMCKMNVGITSAFVTTIAGVLRIRGMKRMCTKDWPHGATRPTLELGSNSCKAIWRSLASWA